MKSFEKNFKIYQIFFVLIFLLFIVNIDVSKAEWTGPSGNPPDNNVTAPLNQGTTPQFKDGALHIGDSTTMGGYEFSVSNGASYFGDLEVGGMATITASTGGFETKGNVTLQGSDLMIEDSGILSMNSSGGGMILNGGTVNGSNVSIITSKSGTAVMIRDDNTSVDSVAIGAGILNGTAIFGTSGTGIGIFGIGSGNGGIGVVGSSTHSNAFAGRFDGEVGFNPLSGSTYSEINGGTMIFDNMGKVTTITPMLIESDAASIILKAGDIDVEFGEIDMHINNIINVANPVWPGDAVNLQTLAWEHGTGNEIYYNETDGYVGIGTDAPSSDLHIYSTGSGQGSSDINLEYDFIGAVNGSRSSNWILRAASDGGKFHIIDSTNERLTIDSDGVVGIGTTAPSAGLKLDVEGKVGATEYCDNDGLNCVTAGSIAADNLGDHVATQDLYLVDYSLKVGQEVYIKTGTPNIQGSIEIGASGGPVTLEVNGDITASDTITGGNLNVDGAIIVGGDISTPDIFTENVEHFTSGASIEFDDSGNIIITIP